LQKRRGVRAKTGALGWKRKAIEGDRRGLGGSYAKSEGKKKKKKKLGGGGGGGVAVVKKSASFRFRAGKKNREQIPKGDPPGRQKQPRLRAAPCKNHRQRVPKKRIQKKPLSR